MSTAIASAPDFTSVEAKSAKVSKVKKEKAPPLTLEDLPAHICIARPELKPLTEDLSVLKRSFFSVTITQIEDFFPENITFSDDFAQIVHTDDNHVLGIHGSSYTLTSNEEFIMPLVDSLIELVGYENILASVRSINDQIFYYDFVIRTMPFKIQENDTMYIAIRATNSYNGSCRQSVMAYHYRMVCTNGLYAMMIDEAIGKKHQSGNIITTTELKTLVELSNTAVEKYKMLTDRRLTPDEVEELTEVLTKKTQLPKKKVHLLGEMAAAEAAVLGGADINAWMIYNAANNLVNFHYGTEDQSETYRYKLDAEVLKVLTNHLQISFN